MTLPSLLQIWMPDGECCEEDLRTPLSVPSLLMNVAKEVSKPLNSAVLLFRWPQPSASEDPVGLWKSGFRFQRSGSRSNVIFKTLKIPVPYCSAIRIWLKVVSFDGSLLKGAARRLSANFARLPSFRQPFKVLERV
jgi:hypothetical protein